MNSKKKTWTIVITIVVLLVGGITTWALWPEPTIDLENYQPSAEFEPAYEAMEAKAPEYDIEETVRIMNALENAQYQSEDFMSYLEFVAKQDYTKVALDVLEQKKKLFPILQHLFELQKQNKELDDAWMIIRSAGTGAATLAENVSPIGLIGSICTGDATLSTLSVTNGVDKAKTAAFEEYEKQKELKKKLEKEIEKVRMSYIEYLEGYAPVYYKYMKEWDALCLKKDKAYIDLYGGRPIESYNLTQEILKQYPTNREALLLKSLSLISIASNYHSDPSNQADSTKALSVYKEMNLGGKQPNEINEFYIEAENTLDNYITLYPSRSAPALVLKGLLYRNTGDMSKAISFFDQASMEYPRQAADLTDLLDAYRNRSYLNKSSEGKYLLRLYRSTMEGFGLFSPNLLKAKYYSQQGDVDNSKTEIFNHFFRRGNQGIYDCLLSDMQYCEENMYSSFKQILIEQSFLDVSVEPTLNWTLTDKDDEIKVTINNRSDIDLENVRIFLCLHYTDMYKDEYDVQKLPAVNIIKHNDKTEIGVVKLTYEDKKYNDITHIRAIAMTDDKICWIDNVDYKYMRASEASAKQKKAKPNDFKQQLLEDFNVDGEALRSVINTGIGVYANLTEGEGIWNEVKSGVKNLVTGNDKKLRIELPRILSIIDPVFSLNQINDKDKAVRPTENYLSGSNIRLKFDYEPKKNDTIPLYIYSDIVNFKVTIQFTDGKPSVKSVELV
ncbi:MAG: hypothetical protein KBT29_00180 [Prevotellaceae bacterium]|nr:hypothetical protein [Candidatus Minthosoma caballi]